MSKGSKRRPAQVTDDKVRENWGRIFKPKKEESKGDELQRIPEEKSVLLSVGGVRGAD